MTPQAIAAELAQIADSFVLMAADEVRAKLYALAEAVVADVPVWSERVSGLKGGALTLVADEDPAPFPASPADGWDYRVSRQPDGLWRVKARSGSRVLTLANQTPNRVELLDTEAEWARALTNLRRKLANT